MLIRSCLVGVLTTAIYLTPSSASKASELGCAKYFSPQYQFARDFLKEAEPDHSSLQELLAIFNKYKTDNIEAEGLLNKLAHREEESERVNKDVQQNWEGLLIKFAEILKVDSSEVSEFIECRYKGF